MAIISDPVQYIGVWVSRAVPLSDQIYGWQMSTGKGGGVTICGYVHVYHLS